VRVAAIWSVNIAVANPMVARWKSFSLAKGQRITARLESQLLYPLPL
jgi:hypothetical protein